MARITLPKESVGEQITASVVLDEYCRYLTVKLEGAELEKKIAADKKRREQNGLDVTMVNTKERYETTFRNVKINKKGDEPTAAEKALKSKVFDTKERGKSIEISKATCPRFFVKGEDGKLRKLDLDGKSLEGGQAATAVWSVYETKNSHGPQIGFEGLIFDEEPKLWKPSGYSFGGYTVEADANNAAAPVEAPAETTTAAADDWED